MKGPSALYLSWIYLWPLRVVPVRGLHPGCRGDGRLSPSVFRSTRAWQHGPAADLRRTRLRRPLRRPIPLAASVVADDVVPVSAPEGESFASTVANLVKYCLGLGIMSLPSGVAAISSNPSALFPAAALLLGCGSLSAYTFYVTGMVCREVGARSMGEAWRKSVDRGGGWLINYTCFLVTLGITLGFSIELGNISSVLLKGAGVQGLLATRQACVLLLTAVALYPLVSLKSLASLAPVSVVGVLGNVAVILFMALRLLRGCYGAGGRFLSSLAPHLRPAFSDAPASVLQPSSLVLVSMAATGYLAHFGAGDFYAELEDATPKKFAAVTAAGYLLVTLLSTCVMSLGFTTFGAHSAGIILNNYAATDAGATVCRMLLLVSLLGSFPLIFAGMKESYVQLVGLKDDEITDRFQKKIKRIMLAVITFFALCLENTGFVMSFCGSLLCSVVIYVFPCVMNLSLMNRRLRAGDIQKTKRLRLERMFNKSLIGFGGILSLIGGTVTILSYYFPAALGK